ncbi:hypothetical protein DPMN_192214 [Dreissena polymorpha]|uniref:Uncharacterized protein n=1 Tax=Dreissena polymorpha TaxID=45954 RepID=A0A9D3Y0Q4_DREPO|nr:hypothetical protein DPMN_192214 [Dreissena polymorpha]
MQIFAECDCNNYLCYVSWYLERITVIEFTDPHFSGAFPLVNGLLGTAQAELQCCSVADDTKVEQTIQRVSKGPGGHVVGETRASITRLQTNRLITQNTIFSTH